MENIQEILKTLPHTPGVYFFRGSDGTILYIGKAIDISRRVRQYFSGEDAGAPKTNLLVSQVRSIDTVQTVSEFDALLLEAKLIRQYAPKYNVIAKDDKSPLYIYLTLDTELPRVLLLRKNSLPYENIRTKESVFGPFQSSGTARKLLRTLRKIVPYCTQKRRDGIPCFYTHIGLCNPCPSTIVKMTDTARKRDAIRLYRRNIFRLRDILSGKSISVLSRMERRVTMLAAVTQFEEAASLRNQIVALRTLLVHRYDPSLYSQDIQHMERDVEAELESLRTTLADIYPGIPCLSRIECIDISNLGPGQASGSLAVLTNGYPDTSQYRRFKIRQTKGPNDPAMIAEVLSRRLLHTEWKMPDLLIVDGGKPQLQHATDVLEKSGSTIPVIGLSKRREEILVRKNRTFVTLRLRPTNSGLHVVQRIRDEAHRFALSYHRLRRLKNLLTTSAVV